MRLLFAANLLVFALTVAAPAKAQSLPPTTSADMMGMDPYESYHGGDFDVVGLTSGMLNVNLPFLTYPQRGKLHLSFHLFYNNQWQHRGELCLPHVSCMFIWGYVGIPPALPLERSDVFVGPAEQKAVYGTNFQQTYGGTVKYTVSWANWNLLDADGSKHPLANLGTMTELGQSPSLYYQYSGPWETLDATATRVNGTFAAAITGPGQQVTPTSIIDADGVSYATANAFEEDPNGNKITLSSGTYTDSLQRQIMGPSSPTDTSGCPQPPQVLLPVDHAGLWSVPGPGGNMVYYKFCYAIVTINIPPGSPDSAYPAYSGTRTNLQSIVLPNLQTWNFEYNDPGDGSTYNGSPINYATLTQITLPTGGTISYLYGQQGSVVGCAGSGRWVASRTVNANDGTGPHTWTYSYTLGGGGSASSTTVTDPLGNYTIHTFGLGTCSAYETEAQYYQNGGTLLKTVSTTYNAFLSRNSNEGTNVVPLTVQTTWPNQQTSIVTKTYDAGVDYTDWLGSATNGGPGGGSPNVMIYGKVLTETDSDYGNPSPGPVLRTKTNTYQALNNSSYLTNNLLDLPASIKVTGGSQTAYTTYGYDENALTSSGVSTQRDTSPPDGIARGNQTSIHRQLNNGSTTAVGTCPAVSSGGYLVTNITYFDTGMVNVSKDPCTYSTTYAYDPVAYFGAYPTSVTNALNQATTYTYDLNTGLRASTTDPNLQKTSFTYDSMWRLASVTYPDGASSTITRQETTFPNTATLTKAITTTPVVNYVTTNTFDGLGRVTESLVTDPQGNIKTDTTYDPDGRKYTVSNPYRTNTDSTYGLTTYIYDGIGRTCVVIPPDGTAVTNYTCPTTQPSNDVFTTYSGNTTTVTDQQGKSRESQIDGLGRLTNVWEDPAGLNYQTVYTYDALGDLTTVVQGGSHNRSFVFDSLKRLTSSTNPETGTTPVTYTYDADSNVHSKTDARSITITYGYDVLNRMTGRTYSNGDPAVTYTYDQPACLSLSACYNIGRRTAMSDAGGSENWAYDKMGREWAERRITNSITNNTAYTYNLDGTLATLTYPSGRVITYTTDPVERPAEAQDVANSIKYVMGTCADGTDSNGVCYAPQGAVAGLVLGQASGFAGISLGDSYNSRLQPNELKASSTAGTAMDLTYSFVDTSSHNNGNVMQITNNKDTTRTQQFTYDHLNRILTAETTSTHATSPANCWGEAYVYDNNTTSAGEFGNLTNINAASSAYTGCIQESPLSVMALPTNQLSATGFSYDASGNILTDGHNTYGWNAESEIKSAAGVNYTYDGDGNRLQKSNGKIYWYGAGTEILDESDASGNITDEYVYFGGKRIAHRVVSGNSIYYYAEDFLGTSRIMTTSTGTVCYESDFYPFGGERNITNTCPQNYKFEGKERDTETNNDDFGARYYSSQFGRWLSPDWSATPAPVPYADLTNPQTLNLYAMVHDNPETFADLDGHSDYIWQRIKNKLSGKGWKTDAQVKGWDVAQTAHSHVGSKDWAINTTNTSGKDVGHPQVFKPGSDKCNQYVGDTLAEAGKTRPEIKDKDGNTRMPSSHEMADPNVHIPGLSDTRPLSEAKAGDVIAQEHGDVYGHAGIVVGPGETSSANASGNYGGQITENDWGFRPAGQNGESSEDPAPVVRHPEDQ